MKKAMYRIVDAKGRVYLPKEMREDLGLEPGSFVKLAVEKDSIRLNQVHFIEVGDHSPENIEAYVRAATAKMPREKQIEIAAKLLELARKEAAS